MGQPRIVKTIPEVSIVMTARLRATLLRRTLESIFAQYSRPTTEIIVVEDGSDGGETLAVCNHFGVSYYLRRNRPDVPYSNPAVPINIGLRRATGEVVILQNAECAHAAPDAIERLVAPHRAKNNIALFASVSARHPDGQHWHWYVHPFLDAGPRPFFFCGSLRREHIERLRGMDEDFKGYGYEDDDWAARLGMIGVEFRFDTDIVIHHQWHPSTNCFGLESSRAVYNAKVAAVKRKELGPERNIGREWGSLES